MYNKDINIYSEDIFVNIADISNTLKLILTDLINQYVAQVTKIDNDNKYNKQYLNNDQAYLKKYIQNIEVVKSQLDKFFSEKTHKTRADLYMLLDIAQISERSFNDYVYKVLLGLLLKEPVLKKKENKEVFNSALLWEHYAHNLIINFDKYENNIGNINIDPKVTIDQIDLKLKNNKNEGRYDSVIDKLILIESLSKSLRNYFCDEVPYLNIHYRDSILMVSQAVRYHIAEERLLGGKQKTLN